jgi:hypothetical protein
VLPIGNVLGRRSGLAQDAAVVGLCAGDVAAAQSRRVEAGSDNFAPQKRPERGWRNAAQARQSNQQRGDVCAVEAVMRFTTLAAGAAFAAFLACAAARADPPVNAPASGGQSSAALMPAAWTTKELNFVYKTGFTTKYSCDGLRDKVREILAQLGAHDIQVHSYGCMNPAGPDLFPSVHIRMSVLQPAHEWAVGNTVPAHWKTVDLLSNRDVLDVASDCELIEQLKQKVLPLFATRNVAYRATCEKQHLVVGGTELKVDVLAPQQGLAAASAAR